MTLRKTLVLSSLVARRSRVPRRGAVAGRRRSLQGPPRRDGAGRRRDEVARRDREEAGPVRRGGREEERDHDRRAPRRGVEELHDGQRQGREDAGQGGDLDEPRRLRPADGRGAHRRRGAGQGVGRGRVPARPSGPSVRAARRATTCTAPRRIEPPDPARAGGARAPRGRRRSSSCSSHGPGGSRHGASRARARRTSRTASASTTRGAARTATALRARRPRAPARRRAAPRSPRRSARSTRGNLTPDRETGLGPGPRPSSWTRWSTARPPTAATTSPPSRTRPSGPWRSTTSAIFTRTWRACRP